MKTETRSSGLVVPVHEPTEAEQQKRRSTPLEIANPELRKKAKDALRDLWDAMELREGYGILTDHARYEAWYQAWRYMGKMLLGKDCSDDEVLT